MNDLHPHHRAQWALVTLLGGALAGSSLSAGPYFKVQGGGDTLCLGLPLAGDDVSGTAETLEAGAVPPPFSLRWRPGLRLTPPSQLLPVSEVQWTEKYYTYEDNPEEAFFAAPEHALGNAFRQQLSKPGPAGNAADYQIRTGRRWQTHNSRYSLQHWAASGEGDLTLSFENFATGDTPHNGVFAVKLYGAEWACPWDDMPGARCCAFPNGYFLRKASSTANLNRIRITSSPITRGDFSFRDFALEIQGPGIGSGDPASYGSLICIFRLWSVSEAADFRQTLQERLLSASSEAEICQALGGRVAARSTGTQTEESPAAGEAADRATADRRADIPPPSTGAPEPTMPPSSVPASPPAEAVTDLQAKIDALQLQFIAARSLPLCIRLQWALVSLEALPKKYSAYVSGYTQDVPKREYNALKGALEQLQAFLPEKLLEERYEIRYGSYVTCLQSEFSDLQRRLIQKGEHIHWEAPSARMPIYQRDYEGMTEIVRRIVARLTAVGGLKTEDAFGEAMQKWRRRLDVAEWRSERFELQLIAARSQHLCIRLQRALAAIRNLETDRAGNRSVPREACRALHDATKALRGKVKSLLEQATQGISSDELFRASKEAFAIFQEFEELVTAHFAPAGGADVPASVEVSQTTFAQIAGAVRNIVKYLTAVSELQMEDTDGAEIAKLKTENAQLKTENGALRDEIAALRAASPAPH